MQIGLVILALLVVAELIGIGMAVAERSETLILAILALNAVTVFFGVRLTRNKQA